MAENKKYYYLKLKEDFFDTEEMKILENMPNGYLYSNILLKMYLKSIKNNGELIFREAIPYNVDMLSTITGHNRDIVQQALKVFKNLNLIDIFDNGKIYMLDIQTLIGQISSEGIRKAEYRQRIDKEKINGTGLGQSPDIISLSISNSKSNGKPVVYQEKKAFTPPSLDEVIKFAESKGVKELGNKFYEYYTTGDRDWVDSKGNKVRNWKQKLLTWINYNSNGAVKKPDVNIKTHDYTAAELGALFDNIEDFDKGGLVV